MDINATLDQAIVAIREGRKAEARQLLESVLDADERNEKAWLWLGSVVDSNEERIICLENVLTVNPNNEMARKGLAVLRAESATREPSEAGTVEALPEPSPTAEGTQPPVVPPTTSRVEAAAEEAPPGPSAKTDSRAFIVITIVLAVMLICTVLCILAFVTLSPLG